MNNKPVDRAFRKAVWSSGNDFWLCPNSGEVIRSTQGDNKVLCGCGKPNPRHPLAKEDSSAEHGHGGPVTHLKNLLETATVDAFMEQEDRERKSEDGE